MSPEQIKAIVEVLSTGGPWTLVLTLAGVVKYLYQAREQDRLRYDDEKQKLNDRIINMSEKQNELFDKAETNQKLLLEVVRRN
jgi:hypothetical protein